MKATARQPEQSRVVAPWATEETATLFDVSIKSIPGVSVVYQSLKEWQAECAPRVYPRSDFSGFDRKRTRETTERPLPH